MKVRSKLAPITAFTLLAASLILFPQPSIALPTGFSCTTNEAGRSTCSVSASSNATNGGKHNTSNGSSASEMTCTYSDY